jgi:hypothetical protein
MTGPLSIVSIQVEGSESGLPGHRCPAGTGNVWHQDPMMMPVTVTRISSATVRHRGVTPARPGAAGVPQVHRPPDSESQTRRTAGHRTYAPQLPKCRRPRAAQPAARGPASSPALWAAGRVPTVDVPFPTRGFAISKVGIAYFAYSILTYIFCIFFTYFA